MTSPPALDSEELFRRISRDVADSYDEEFELEIEDRHPRTGVPEGADADPEADYRRRYFSELFRLQAELIKLQKIALG